MSDPSSFAETPLAQLRKLVEECRRKAARFRAKACEPEAASYAYESVADRLSALLTDLEAAPPPGKWSAEEEVEAVKQQLPDGAWRQGASLARCVEDLRMDRDRLMREGEAAASRPHCEHCGEPHGWTTCPYTAVSPAVEGGREDELLKEVDAQIDGARGHMNEAVDFLDGEYYRGWHDAYFNVRNWLRAALHGRADGDR